MHVPEDKSVLVTGATGFIGKDVVARLLQRGWHVRAMARRLIGYSFPASDRLTIVQADLRDQASLREATRNVAVVVHLAAAKMDENDSEEINVGGASLLIRACKARGCRRIINISTQSVKIARKGTYARTKHAADNLFHKSGLAVTTLMPSVVYGEEMSGVFGTIVKFVKKLPVVPVLGDGQWLSAPVYVGDVSSAIIAAIEADVTIGRKYDIGGPDQLSFDDLVDSISAALGIQRPKLHIPFTLALCLAKIVATLVPKPPITVSNVLGGNQNTDIDITPAKADFNYNPISLDEGIRLLFCSGPVASSDEDDALRQEAWMMGQYLLDRKPPPSLVDRYVAANRTLLAEHSIPRELRCVRRHPWALPFFDAAAGLLRPRSVLRQKIVVMAAVLEATPGYSEFFLKKPDPLLRQCCSLAWQGTRSVTKLLVGVPLWLVLMGWES